MLSVPDQAAVNRPSAVRTMVCETRSPVMAGIPESTRTVPLRQREALPAASVARTAMVHVPVVSGRLALRVVIDSIGDQAPDPFRYFTRYPVTARLSLADQLTATGDRLEAGTDRPVITGTASSGRMFMTATMLLR